MSPNSFHCSTDPGKGQPIKYSIKKNRGNTSLRLGYERLLQCTGWLQENSGPQTCVTYATIINRFATGCYWHTFSFGSTDAWQCSDPTAPRGGEMPQICELVKPENWRFRFHITVVSVEMLLVPSATLAASASHAPAARQSPAGKRDQTPGNTAALLQAMLKYARILDWR